MYREIICKRKKTARRVTARTDASLGPSNRQDLALMYRHVKEIPFHMVNPSDIMALQRVIGNGTVRQLIETKMGEQNVVQRQAILTEDGVPMPPQLPPIQSGCHLEKMLLWKLLKGEDLTKAQLFSILVCCHTFPGIGKKCSDLVGKVLDKLKKKPEKPERPPVHRPPSHCPAPYVSTILRGKLWCSYCNIITGVLDCCEQKDMGDKSCRRCPTDCPMELKENCIRMPICPIPYSWDPATGKCCSILGDICCDPSEEDVTKGGCPKTPRIKLPPTPKKTKKLASKTIEFEFDAPKTWYDEYSAFRVSLTPKGHQQFNELETFLNENPELMVELIGHASSRGEETYNMKLAGRRAKLILDELKKRRVKNIDSRVSDVPDTEGVPGCVRIDTGMWSCGETRAAQETDKPEDRVVMVRYFYRQ